MQPSKEVLAEFMQIYEAEFHETLSEKDATKMWISTMEFFLLVMRKESTQQVIENSSNSTDEKISFHPFTVGSSRIVSRID